MASPQKENGFTPIANEIMEAIAKMRIPGEARQVLDVILRKTYGWNKKNDIISLSQFVDTTGLNKVHVCRMVNRLLEMNLITKKGKGITNNGKDVGQIYEFNKDYEGWKPLPKKVTLPNRVITVTKKGNNPLPNRVHTKESIKEKKSIKEQIPEFLDKDLWEEFLSHRKKLRKPMTDYAQNLMFKKLEWMKEKGHNIEHLLKNAMVKGYQDIYEPKD